MPLIPEAASMSSVLITTTLTAIIESTVTFTSEYLSTHHSILSQTITTASAMVIESTATITSTYQSTYHATLYSTITIIPSPISWSLLPPATLSTLISSSAVITLTEVPITIVQPEQTSVSTLTLSPTATYTTGFPPSQPSSYVVVVGSDHHDHGWDSWSSAQKGGLIAGVVLAFLLILACAVFWCNSRKKIWLASDWSLNSHPAWGMNQPGQLVTQGHNSWNLRGGGKVGVWQWLKLARITRKRQHHRFLHNEEDIELKQPYLLRGRFVPKIS